MLKTLKVSSALLALVSSFAAYAVADIPKRIDVPAGELVAALETLSRQAAVDLVFQPDQLKSFRTDGVSGTYSPEDAIRILLKGTPLQLRTDASSGAMVIAPAAAPRTSSISRLRIAQADSASASQGKGGRDATGNEDEQSPQSSKVASLEEIVVTAQKREERLLEVPMSISVLSGDSLAEQRIANLLDVSRAIPGMVVNDSGPGRRRVGLRGVGNTFGAQPLVGIYLDEIPAAGFNDAVVDLQTYDLERVEVLRGPQGTLYGEGSTSGTIRFITRKPDLARAGFTSNVKLLTIDHGAGAVDYDGAANIPLVEDTLGLRLSGRYLHGGGWIDQPLTGARDINDQKLADGRAQLRWQGERFIADAMVVIHRNDAGASNRGEDVDGNFTQAFLANSTPSARDDFDMANLTLEYDLGRVSIISASSYIDIRKTLLNDGNTIPLVAPPAPLFQFLSLRQDSDGHSFSQELRVSSNGGGPLTYTLGGYYRDSQLNRFNDSVFGLTLPGTAIIQIIDNGSEAWSAFGDISYKLRDDLEVGTGLRYFEDQRTNFDGAVERATRFESVTPRFYVRYALSDSVSLYGNVAQGFRSGGFNAVGQASYDPEKLWSYEIGAKAALPEQRLNMEATVFYSEYDNVQVVGITGASLGRSLTSNLGAAWVKGLEGSIGFAAVDGLTLGATGSVYRSEVTELDVSGGSHQVGDPLDAVPKYSLSTWADYDFALTASMVGRLQINYGRKGVSYYRNRSVGPFFYGESAVVDLLGASFGIERAAWRFSVFVDNALDERGYLDPFAVEGSAARPQPRTFGVSVGITL
ncbi:MAG: TonB-dependent receptor [Pseudomonadota bacterium]|nr:TonB-dependent receptor [Pseudomonadota bacterium]